MTHCVWKIILINHDINFMDVLIRDLYESNSHVTPLVKIMLLTLAGANQRIMYTHYSLYILCVM